MKCYYTFDRKTNKKIFIPMCYSSINGSNCSCPDPLTDHHFQKERYNEVVKQKNQSIAEFQSEIKHLHNVIKNLKQKLK